MHGWLGVMPAYLSRAGSLSTKIVTTYQDNVAKYGIPSTQAIIVLNNPETGNVEAVIEGSYITAMRTGAVSGVATKYLARKDARSLGLFGGGVQARTQLEAISEVRDIQSVSIYDIDKTRAMSFISHFTADTDIKIKASNTPQEVVGQSDIVVTATTSKTPVFDGHDLKPGTHINAIGAFTPGSREIDDETVSGSKIIVDSMAAALEEADDIIIPLNKGIITREDIHAELGEIVSGSKPGRTDSNERTLFKSVGLGIQDAAVARLVFNKAQRQKIGLEIDLAG